ncbi:Panacea domain-containing protein [Eoetvoesiella caeni]|uniref:Uncharacterized protein DUF4065 n=1 Tax=Eoetvoesiella caeni TaxID=645616 RepID=A0A366H0J2_9BURK|nr:Panacea domain-containing protein [Eoetvoesiella caeni]MCI2811025.1 SocA family protein [Eoetvoesiella caeni]NYT56925.1 SocA family protein [Eoetvoesiella caeni]RBP35249.1 uncharacterized protein DUF4065 [Eoetvoesiella caeni]
MLIHHEREKLVEAVKFFALNTRKLGKTKLYKLLYFLDFTHYRDTGRPVTGMEYFAWPMGPVPVEFHNELDNPSKDWEGNCLFKSIPVRNGKEMLSVQALNEFNPLHFSKREVRIMQELASEFRDATADEMVERTHLENLPWHQIYEVEKRKQQQIPYAMSLRKQDFEHMVESIKDRKEIIAVLEK